MATEIQNVEKKIGVFITAHHLLLYALLGVAVLGGVYLFVSKRADVAEAKAQAAEQALAIEKDHSTQLANLYAANQVQRDKENTLFTQTITQLRSQAQVQIIHDKTLPAPDLSHRIESITGFKQGTISLNATDLIIPLPLGQEIVARLDQGEADSQMVIQQNGIIKNQAATIKDQTAIIAEDKVVLAQQIKTDGAELSSCKASARKGKLKWFGIGYATGFASAIILKIYHP